MNGIFYCINSNFTKKNLQKFGDFGDFKDFIIKKPYSENLKLPP